MGQLSDQALTDALLGAGAYLGETIRSNAADEGHWQWMGHEQAALRDPGFASARPREITVLAILDSPEQMAYPFAHVAAIVDGSATATAHGCARLLGVTDSAGGPVRRQGADEGSEDSVQAAAERAAWRAQLRREEKQLDTAGSFVGLALQVLCVCVLAYTVKFTLSAFGPAAAALGLVKTLAYGAWVIAPSLCLAAYIIKSDRRFVLQCYLLVGSAILATFSYVAYSSYLSPKTDPDSFTVFQWVPLVQFVWAVGWARVARQYVDDL